MCLILCIYLIFNLTLNRNNLKAFEIVLIYSITSECTSHIAKIRLTSINGTSVPRSLTVAMAALRLPRFPA